MNLTPAQIAFATISALSVGQLAFLAPSGRFLVTTPPAHHAERDPSIRQGSAGSHSYFFWGGSGGYHGGK